MVPSAGLGRSLEAYGCQGRLSPGAQGTANWGLRVTGAGGKGKGVLSAPLPCTPTACTAWGSSGQPGYLTAFSPASGSGGRRGLQANLPLAQGSGLKTGQAQAGAQ